MLTFFRGYYIEIEMMSIVEDRCWRTDDGGQMSDDRGQISDDRRFRLRNADCGMVNQGAEKRYRKWEGKYAEVEKDE